MVATAAGGHRIRTDRIGSLPPVPYPLAPELPQDAPDPWDLLPPEPATITLALDRSTLPSPHRRPGRGINPRLLLVGAVVAILLIGSGALAQNLVTGPTGFPAPTPPPGPLPAPSTTASADPTEVEGRLGAAPAPATPTPVPTSPTSPVPTTTAAPGTTASAPTPTPTVTVVTYEAEQADLRSTAEAYQVETASAGYAVRGLGGLFSGEVRFPVEVDQAGEYELTLYYLAERPRSGQVRVNGGSAIPVNFPGLSAPDEVGAVSLTVTLQAGHNEIRFGNPLRSAPVLDRITLTPL